jgi:hypothetical protein
MAAVRSAQLAIHRKLLVGRAMNADTACIETPTAPLEPTMNTSTFRTAPRFAAVAFAAFMTLATLLSVAGLAEYSTQEVLMAQATAVQHKA